MLLIIGLTLPPAVRAQRIFPPQHVAAGPGSTVIGTSLFFNGWVKAKVVSHNAFFADDSIYSFDFDKGSQELLAFDNKETVYRFNRREFESVTFYADASALTFGHVPAINDKDIFLEVVKNDHKYSLYLRIHSLITGNGYADRYTYYILFPFPNTRVLRLNIVDKRLIDHAFDLNSDRQKVDAYYALYGREAKNEYFLKKLIEYLNE